MATESPQPINVVNVTEATFNTEVVDASMTTPVLVDFWATWCGPCRTLGPLLEKLVGAYRGAVRLAKVDVDQNPTLAQHFEARSIPMVLAIYKGAVVDQFVGALPPQEVKRFIERLLEDAGVPPRAEASVQAPSDPAKAEAFWRAALADAPGTATALLGLGRALLALGRDGDARTTLQQIEPREECWEAAQVTLRLGGLFAEVREAGGEAAVRSRLDEDPTDGEATYLVACADAAQGRLIVSLGSLVGLVATAGAPLRDRAKAAAATVFEAAGRGDDEVEALRRKLARLLY